MLISFVVPCYNSEKTIGTLVDLTIEEIKKMPEYSCEFILVNDFSKDGTYHVLREIAKRLPCVKVIDLSKNFGQHNAILAGMNFACGDLIVGMDDDLQTHPSQIPLLIHKLLEGYDIVYASYPEKKHSLFRNLASKMNDLSVRWLIENPKGLKATSFWIIRKFVRDEVIRYKGSFSHLQGLFLRTSRNIGTVPVVHFERTEGKSNYTFRKLLKLWGSFTNFTVVPLRFASILGIIAALAGFFGALYIFIQRLFSPDIPLGWSSTMVAVLFFSGLILLFIGILGEYIGRIFITLNSSPQYVIREKINVDENKE